MGNGRSSLAGVTVDTTTFEASDAADGSLAVVPMTNNTQPWSDEPYVYTERNAGDTQLGFTITNEGAFHAELTLIIRIFEDPIVFEDTPLRPASAVVLSSGSPQTRSDRSRRKPMGQ